MDCFKHENTLPSVFWLAFFMHKCHSFIEDHSSLHFIVAMQRLDLSKVLCQIHVNKEGTAV